MIQRTLIPLQSAASDITGTYSDIGDLINYSIHVIITGADVAGTLTLESSDDGSNFVTVDNSSQSVTNSGDVMYNVTGASYRYVRPFWDYTSGTGNISAIQIIKEVVVKGA